MKFCRPVFRAISRIDKELARKTFLEHALEFHPIAVTWIKKVRWFCGNYIKGVYIKVEIFSLIGYWIGLKKEFCK